MSGIRRFLRAAAPFQIITASFSAIILLGSVLLSLPVSTVSGNSCPYLDALFTSASAVCVTGLVVHNTAVYWSAFGKAVILVLIQIGGLGVVTVAIAVSIFTGRRIGLRERNLMQNAVNAPELGGIIRFTRFLLFFTLAAEAAGSLLLFPVFAPAYGTASGIRKAVFHSVSAFCNAGFDLLGDKTAYASLTHYRADPLLNIVIMGLIISGGLGFLTWEDLWLNRFRFRKLRLQTKLILISSLVLILLPALFFFLSSFRTGPAGERILLSLFQSVTTRTAGFNTAALDAMPESAQLMMIVLMLVGGSPGSTAGGLKTTAFAVILIGTFSSIRQRKVCSIFGRSVAMQNLQDAFTLLVLYLCLLLAGSVSISLLEGLPVLPCMFETASALGTVGLTLGITPSIGPLSKLILICYMYFGRVGGLTLAYAAVSALGQQPGRLPEEKIMIG